MITVISATKFIGTIGVDTHIAYTDGTYSNIQTVVDDLGYLGVTHVRDGISDGEFGSAQISSYIQVAKSGVHFTFLTAAGGAQTDATLSAKLALIDQVQASVPGSVTAIEGANEINNQPITWNGEAVSDGYDELQAALSYQRALYAMVHSDPVLSGVVVDEFTGYGAGDIPDAPDVGVTPGLADYDTQHPYPNFGQAPAFWMAAAHATPGNTAPIVYTETGYSSNGGTSGAVNEDVQAKYTLDLLFDDAKAGVVETDLYDLLDAYAPGSRQGDDGYGLFDYTGAPKPIAIAIHNLTSILADSGDGTASNIAASNNSITGLPTTGNSLLIAKSDGTTDIAVWAEPQIWDEATGTENLQPATAVTVNLGAEYSSVEIFDPLSSAAPIQTLSNVSSVDLDVTDHPLIVQVGPRLTKIDTPPSQSVADAPKPGQSGVIADFSHNGTSSILLQNSDGGLLIEVQSNLQKETDVSLGNPGASWHVTGTADFDGDGNADLILQNDDGHIVDFLMNGTGIAQGVDLGNSGSNWHVRGTGDFNGDGKADLLLQSDGGAMVVLETNGTNLIAGVYIGSIPSGWGVEGVADFNGDGQPDILVQSMDGTLVDFTMNGTNVASGGAVGNFGNGYSVAGTGDYNGDGKADIVLHNDNGANLILMMNGPGVTNTVSAGNPGANYTNIAAGLDLDGNGTSDLVVQDRTTGTIVGYTLDNTASITAGALLSAPGAGTSLVGSNPISFIDGSGTNLLATPGQDQFVMTATATGLHTITGFDAAQDMLALNVAAFPNYATVQAHEVAYNGGTFIGLSTNSAIIIQGVTPDQLNSQSFVLR
jgi:hypothetical protein